MDEGREGGVETRNRHEIEHATDRRQNLIPEKSGIRSVWHSPDSRSRRRLSAPKSGLCVIRFTEVRSRDKNICLFTSYKRSYLVFICLLLLDDVLAQFIDVSKYYLSNEWTKLCISIAVPWKGNIWFCSVLIGVVLFGSVAFYMQHICCRIRNTYT